MRYLLYRRFYLVSVLLIVVAANVSAQREGAPSPPASVSYLNTRPNFYDTKLTEAQKSLISPLAEDKATFADFLRQDNTGLFRLHPKGKYEPGLTISANEADRDLILPIMGGGAYYSFKEKTNKRGPWTEICLDGNRLSTLIGNKSIGLLSDIGDVPLASVTTTTPGVTFLTKLTAPEKYADIVTLGNKNTRGFEADGYTYAASLEATTETTYALRTIVYKRGGFIVYPNEPYYRLRQSSLGYDGSDTLLAFRIVRRHEDGSVTILWKRLEKFRAPKIKGTAQRFTQKSLQQLFDHDVKSGMSLAQVSTFLDVNSIEHTEYIVGSDHETDAPPGTQGFLYASVPNIDHTPFRIFKLDIRFAFDEKRQLLGYTMKKNPQEWMRR